MESIDTSLTLGKSPKGLRSRLPLKSRARSRTTSSLPTAHNERHQSPACSSGHPVTNLLLKSNSRFQVTFVTNSSSISCGFGIGPGHANQGWDSSLSKLARPCSLHESNPTYGLQFGLAVCPLAQGELVTASRRHSERFSHTYASAALCRTSPPPLGVVGVAPGHSQLLVPGLSGAVSP